MSDSDITYFNRYGSPCMWCSVSRGGPHDPGVHEKRIGVNQNYVFYICNGCRRRERIKEVRWRLRHAKWGLAYALSIAWLSIQGKSLPNDDL